MNLIISVILPGSIRDGVVEQKKIVSRGAFKFFT